MSIRTFEEEKEYQDLTGFRTLILTEKELTEGQQQRIEELEKKEINEEYYFQQDLYSYGISDLSLSELQEEYMILYDKYTTLQDDYNTLEDDFNIYIEEISNNYKQEIQKSSNTSNYNIFLIVILILFIVILITLKKKK